MRTSAAVAPAARNRLQPLSEEDAMEREPLEAILEEAINHPSMVAMEDQLMAVLADDSDQPSDD